MDQVEPTRRTLLAAERTWLAWWRSAIAASTAAIGVGGVVPQLVSGSRMPYELLGAGYAVLAAAMFLGAAQRRRDVEMSLRGGGYAAVSNAWVMTLSAAGGVLALATLVIIILQP